MMHTDISEPTTEHLQEGITQHKSGRLEEARVHYEAVLQLEPNHPVANHNLGLLLMQMGNTEDALSHFVSALQAEPAQGQYWLNYIDALFQVGRTEEARETLALARQHGLAGEKVDNLAQRIGPAEVHQPICSNQHGGPSNREMDDLVSLFMQGKYELAATEGKRLTEQFPEHEFGWKALGVAYKELGKMDDALIPMRRAAELSPLDVEAQYNLGVVLQELDHLDEAEARYRKALEMQQDYVDAHINLGVVLQKAGRLQEAEFSFVRALQTQPDHVAARYNLANILKERGRLSDAEACYRRVLQIAPNHAKAICNLGDVLMEWDKPEEAERNFRDALQYEEVQDEAYFGLGRALKKQGKLKEAEAAYRQSLAFNPDSASVHYNLGNVYKDMGRPNEAEIHYLQAVQIDPSISQAYYNLGNILFDSGRDKEAEKNFRRALEVKPDYAEALCNLGMILKRMRKVDEAENCFRKAIECNHEFADAFLNQGMIYFDKGCFNEAMAVYRQALKINPDFAEALVGLGATLKEMGHLDEAELNLRKALQIKPDYKEAHYNLGMTLKELGRLNESETSIRRALQISPDYAIGHCGLGDLFYNMGRMEEAEACFRQALRHKSDYVLAHSNLIFIMDMMPATDIVTLQEERRRWDAVHASHLLGGQMYANYPDSNRRLRIGYVSGDFRRHSAAFVFGGMLVDFDRDQFEVIAYSNSIAEDALTRHFQQNVTHWRKIAGLPDEVVANMIAEDKIDILVDLSGHSAGNRLLVFARKPAPIQVTAWGYAHGTGMRAMDVFLTDPVSVPPKEKRLYTEQIRYLPNVVGSFFQQEPPPVNELPALSEKYLTFSSFNRLSKNSLESYRVWTEILQACPDSRMIFKTPALDAEDAKAKVLKHFTSSGIAQDRIILMGTTSREEHLIAFNQVDVALDPFPHGGGVSTLDSITMGVPVVTLNWPTLGGRVSSSILTTLGLTDWIAKSSEQYVEIALKKASDLRALSELRQRLRSIFTSSVIGDQAAYVRAVEREYRTLWREWCEKNKPEVRVNDAK